MFIRFDMIHQRDRQTDGQADRHRATAIAALVHSIARQKIVIFSNYAWFTRSGVIRRYAGNVSGLSALCQPGMDWSGSVSLLVTVVS